NGALDGVLRAATASTPTAQGGTTAINANGTVHYVPPQNFTGTDTFTYTATVTVHVFGQPVITTASPLPAATVNQPYTYTLSVSSALPVTWYLPTNLQLPLGLSLNGAGVISGAPTQVGVFTFLVEVADTEGSTTQATVTLAVNGPALQIT